MRQVLLRILKGALSFSALGVVLLFPLALDPRSCLHQFHYVVRTNKTLIIRYASSMSGITSHMHYVIFVLLKPRQLLAVAVHSVSSLICSLR